jgi:hypothetical protein
MGNNNQTVDISAIVNASVEDQVKIAKAAQAARDAYTATVKMNSVKQKAAAQTVSMIQKQTAKSLADAKAAQEKAYRETLVSLGLTAEAYPLETALVAADQKVAKPVLGVFGKIGKLGANIGKYVAGHVKAGYQE